MTLVWCSVRAGLRPGCPAISGQGDALPFRVPAPAFWRARQPASLGLWVVRRFLTWLVHLHGLWRLLSRLADSPSDWLLLDRRVMDLTALFEQRRAWSLPADSIVALVEALWPQKPFRLPKLYFELLGAPDLVQGAQVSVLVLPQPMQAAVLRLA